MARYTGPRTRIARKFGEAIFGADKVLSKKNYPPGQHGNSRKRKNCWSILRQRINRFTENCVTVFLEES